MRAGNRLLAAKPISVAEKRLGPEMCLTDRSKMPHRSALK